MDQLNVFGKDVFQAKTVDGMGVTAADFHHAVLAFGTGETPNFFCCLRNQFGFAKLINESHADPLAG
jgi:hypothetical protein